METQPETCAGGDGDVTNLRMTKSGIVSRQQPSGMMALRDSADAFLRSRSHGLEGSGTCEVSLKIEGTATRRKV